MYKVIVEIIYIHDFVAQCVARNAACVHKCNLFEFLKYILTIKIFLIYLYIDPYILGAIHVCTLFVLHVCIELSIS